jgi:hypothetical protein
MLVKVELSQTELRACGRAHVVTVDSDLCVVRVRDAEMKPGGNDLGQELAR